MKVLISSAIALGLFFSGCSTKQVDANSVEEKKQTTAPVEEKVADKSSANVASTTITTESIYFDFDKYGIRSNMQATATNNSKNIKEYLNQNDAVIAVEGNCDDRGSDEYNYALGLKRAQSIKSNLVANGVAADKIVTKSFGESNPVCTDKTKACWAKNRRVDYSIK